MLGAEAEGEMEGEISASSPKTGPSASNHLTANSSSSLASRDAAPKAQITFAIHNFSAFYDHPHPKMADNVPVRLELPGDTPFLTIEVRLDSRDRFADCWWTVYD